VPVLKVQVQELETTITEYRKRERKRHVQDPGFAIKETLFRRYHERYNRVFQSQDKHQTIQNFSRETRLGGIDFKTETTSDGVMVKLADM
jgi:hypothetical protein